MEGSPLVEAQQSESLLTSAKNVLSPCQCLFKILYRLDWGPERKIGELLKVSSRSTDLGVVCGPAGAYISRACPGQKYHLRDDIFRRTSRRPAPFTTHHAFTAANSRRRLPCSAHTGPSGLVPSAISAGEECLHPLLAVRQLRGIQQAYSTRSRSVLRARKDLWPWSQGTEAAWKGARAVPGWSDTAVHCQGRKGI